MKSPQEKNKLGSGRDARGVSSESDTPPAMKRAGRAHRALSRQDTPKGAKALDVEGAETADTKVRAVSGKGLKKHPEAALGKPAEKKLIRRARP
jgi:hypothetical protein